MRLNQLIQMETISDKVDQLAGRLCAACGMCCNGVMFYSMRLQPADDARKLTALGLRIKRRADGYHMPQPCPAHDGSKCTIYTDRPERCRAFQCRQLRDAISGATSETAAMQIIIEAQKRVAHVLELFHAAGDDREIRAFATRYAGIFTPPLDNSPALIETRDQLQVAMRELEDWLTTYFRIEPLV